MERNDVPVGPIISYLLCATTVAVHIRASDPPSGSLVYELYFILPLFILPLLKLGEGRGSQRPWDALTYIRKPGLKTAYAEFILGSEPMAKCNLWGRVGVIHLARHRVPIPRAGM